ncbi:MAG: dienelactone hydrolase family protein [Verrucomicrobia bacterium]|nr:dienelactone hydrolase family protein [Verrucomicrobiota bacterium]
MNASSFAVLLASLLAAGSVAADDKLLHGTQPLTGTNDLSMQMVAGIDRFLDRELAASVERRAAKWHRDFSSPEAYVKSIEPNRERFKKIIGVVDERTQPELFPISTPTRPALLVQGVGYKVFVVRWPVLRGVDAEGLLLQPDADLVANIIALPDCDWTPEMLAGLAAGVSAEAQFARRLAESGCRVLVPLLMDRRDTLSGNPKIRMTNQPHREFIYRAAFEMGRHIIGYEVQKVLAAVDLFTQAATTGRSAPVGVIGHGEGGLLAFYAAAADTRIHAAAVSGYFQPREQLWREPIYRNVFALLDEFGDAEIASLIAPRALVVGTCGWPEIAGPPKPASGRAGAAPGVLTAPLKTTVAAEFIRAHTLVAKLPSPPAFSLVKDHEVLLNEFLRKLGSESRLQPAGGGEERGKVPAEAGTPNPLADARLKRQFDQLVEHTQWALREGEARRAELWKKPNLDLSNWGFPLAKDSAAAVKKYQQDTRVYRDYLWDEVIGRFPPASLPMNPRTRLVYDEPKYRGYEVMLDVWPDVYAYGILLVPKDLKPGERRPVVVCQHGLEGRPQDCADPKVESRYYHSFANKLAERGFITYSPQNPYIGKDAFRVLQRKLNPLKKTLFAVIGRQHERTLDWLAALPFVDPERIAFYGLSYGGKSAMRLPAMLKEYCLSICSGDYNEWVAKNVSINYRNSYMFTGEYEIFEWNLGNTLNYAEMSWLICPRPFMVERGHFDGCGEDEMVAYEYAKTKRRYDLLGIGDRCEFEYFNGPHEIHAVGTFDFLHKHLNWPKR